ncbi:MAG TPA: alpha/beta hydrolase [Nitrospiraceae bacterium]|nr:alpha/beta hydrolase [Nitrospiraceae bacterium]
MVVVPGIGGSGEGHWQTLWERRFPGWKRAIQEDWDHPVCRKWVERLDQAIGDCPAPPVLVAHSLGCLTVVHWAACASRAVRAALLVAVPDPTSPSFPPAAQGFQPVPSTKLAFPSLVVASSNDPFGSVDFAARCAARWGSEFVDIGAAGHINAESALEEWPAGFALLQRVVLR